MLIDEVHESPVRLAGKRHRHEKRPIDCRVPGELGSEVSKVVVIQFSLAAVITGHRDGAALGAGDGAESTSGGARAEETGVGLTAIRVAADELAQFPHLIFQ